ncbi:MAG TPA: SDR family NAD(P)-dependent oxidoreductase [Kofleriaceae bacterium]|jgi:NADP-dependent 3-hydroxy acid dehydrogenase YdfG|nr:SDR family NAD(P)-dependent oxidoreductase [Kofleriaceae bacterium]
MQLQDRVVVVTGAGSGIGRATALLFAKQGARIAACDIDQARLDSLATELGDRHLFSRKVDVSDRLAMRLFAEEVHKLAPAADVIVNNAGVAMGGPFLDQTLDDWDWILGINLKGVVHGCHYFIPKMVERGTGGHVINISSILGIYGAGNVTSYVATKFAVRGLSLSLREELAPHKIGVTAICPGMINTAIIDDGRMAGAIGDRRKKVASTFKERGASPDKVAAAILDAVHTNPAVRPVGADAVVISALQRLAPRALARIGGQLQRRFGAV